MEQGIHRRKMHSRLWSLIRSLSSMSIALSLVPAILSPALAETNRRGALAAGLMHSCVVMSDGTVQCWGSNSGGQLGNGTRARSSGPVPVERITNATAVATGWAHTCALLGDGRVQCWGSNSGGQLGDGTTTDSLVPVTVSGITNAVAVTATCAVLADGRVQCWGGKSLEPVTVNGITNAVAMATSTCGYTCAILADGRVQCWGHKLHFATNMNESTSIKERMETSSVPETVSGITNAVAVVAQDLHPCALLADGRVQCWGLIQHGELGNGSKSSISSAPVTVNGLSEVQNIAK